MTDQATTDSTAPGTAGSGPQTQAPATIKGSTGDGSGPSASGPDPTARAKELAILDALRSVVDPEIGMNVVELALIKQVILGDDQTEIKMILTTPFCPYAGAMIEQVRQETEAVVEHPVKVTLLAERWDPRDAGLMW